MNVYHTYKDGPVGYGDPEDRTIADTERGTLFSKFVQEKLMFDLCAREWRHWRACIRAHKDSWVPSRKCKAEFALINQCQNTLVQDPEKMKELEDEYLDRRAQFRRTGVGVRFLTKEMLKEAQINDSYGVK
ncbi:unnamed protein product [Hymenolepis diminuta]|uniref:COX assembly mitochondrial protein n=1 Tax=Hymenolepis diminuta TaxID=6216 RepID=A0A0R3SQS8_HYMDI|nr:unnamed protein product [Hymenolepis diminuta]VUZ40118.1 unnamed protein product [Hymenolepis diminuta]